MENFVLYEEVGRADQAIIYKGRRKGTINFLAIHCVEKSKRPQITNTVRLIHELEHENVVRFLEWYETSNHLWLVVELCTGGSLEELIKQDGNLPESSIRKFGVDLITGLHFIHSMGIIFSDLNPAKILLDGPGVLKYADFGLSRVEGEDLVELFDQFVETSEQFASDSESDASADPEIKKQSTQGSAAYTSPEVHQGGQFSVHSDLWSLGCVLYEMFTGHPPFLAEDRDQLVEKIVQKEYPPLRVKGSRLSGKASPDFSNLIDRLLKKEPTERLSWEELVNHPFWKGDLSSLARELVSTPLGSDTVDGSTNRLSISSSLRSSIVKRNSALGTIRSLEVLRKSGEGGRGGAGENLETLTEEERTGSRLSDSFRPKTASEGEVPLFTLSSRPLTAGTPDNDEHLTSPNKLVQSPLSFKDAYSKPPKPGVLEEEEEDEEEEEGKDVKALIYHHSDMAITPIVDNPKIQKPAPLKYDAKTLLVPPYSVEKTLGLSEKDRTKHIDLIIETVNAPEKGPPSQRRVHLYYYIGVLAGNPQLANLLTARGALTALGRQIRDVQQMEIRCKVCRVLGLVANNTTELDGECRLTEVFTILTEVLRDNFRTTRMKLGLLPALGELLFLVASQDEVKGQITENWTVPALTYSLITRCLREGEDHIVNHYAAKVVQNVAIATGVHAQKFAVNEVGLFLWYIYTHSTVDSLRVTALSAICRLTQQSVSVFQCVIEKVGLPKVLDALALGISKIQQAVVTMFLALFTSGANLNRLKQDKDFLLQVMKLLESPSMVVRGKALLLVLEVIQGQTDTLHSCCQSRLVMYIERDSRKNVSKSQDSDQHEYLARCLGLITDHIVNTVPSITKEILSILDTVSGRKHPSTVQAKQLKIYLPLMSVLIHLTTSQVFRPRILTEGFVDALGHLLHHVYSVDCGETHFGNTVGPTGTEDFVHNVFSVLEAIAQHPVVLMEHHAVTMETILPPLAQLLSSANGDTKVLSLRLFSEIASVFLNADQVEASLIQVDSGKLHAIIARHLLPQYEQLLLDQDPLPAYGLKLMHALLEQNSAVIGQLEELGLVAVLFQVLLDHQNHVTGSTMQHLMAVIYCLTTSKETNMKDLYDQGLVEHVINLFIEVTAVCVNSEEQGDSKGPNQMLQTLLDILHHLLKHVSDVVRRALQSKKGGAEGATAEQAEQLLLTNKPFTDLISLLLQLLSYEDSDIAELALKSLSLIVQLFGGENPESMNAENMVCLSEALKAADAKKQKILLRIIKRLVSTDPCHAAMLRDEGQELQETLRGLVQSASSQADVPLSSQAAEILKLAS